MEIVIALRKATEKDLPMMLRWRNHPDLRKWFYSQRDGHIISWDEHLAWFRSRPDDWLTLIIELNSKPIGVLTFGCLDHWAADIGIYVSPENWGKGVAKAAVTEGLKLIKNKWVQATILHENERSKNLFLSLGFVYMCEARPGEGLYRLSR